MIDFDPFSPEVMGDPLPHYARLREQSPIHYVPEYDTFFLSRFDDAWELLSSNDGTFGTAESPLPTPEALRRHHRGEVVVPSTDPLVSFAFLGSPHLEGLRRTQLVPMMPRPVSGLAGWIRELARERLDVLLPRGRFDLTQQYGGIVAATVQCRLLGIPLQEAGYVLDLVNASSLTDPDRGGNVEQFTSHRDRLREVILPAVRATRASSDGSLPIVDNLLAYRLDGRALTDAEIASTMAGTLIGGSETIPKVVAHGLWELYARPDQLAAVREDPAERAGQSFREMVRLCGPAQWFLRTVQRPTAIGGQAMEVGQRVAYILPSVARDPREYGDDADQFRWDRPIRRWVNFGLGQHFCIGYHLALLEGAILVEEFVRRVPSFDVVVEEAWRPPSSFQWGWNRLPVRVPLPA